ncbi:MAG TPA: O-antigen ligase family protein [Jatrophihabitans sp.]|nr:O-antigen ligase family protein [Jatrophihabitans sp.]
MSVLTAPPARPQTATRLRRGSFERFAVISMAIAVAAQPLLHPSGPGNSSPVDVFTLVSLLAVLAWAASARVRVRAPYAFAVGLMVLGGAIAGAAGPLPGTALLTIVQDIVLAVWCAALATLASSPRRLALLANAWAYASVVAAAILVAGYLAHISAITGVVAREGNRVLFTFGDPNYAATYWTLSIFVLYACGRPRHRGLRVLGYVLLGWALLLTESNGGVVEVLVGLSVIAILTQTRRRGAAGGIATALVIVGIAASAAVFLPVSKIQTWARDSGQSYLENSIGRSNDSSAQRGQLISESFQLYAQDGWLGSGPASTKQLLTDRGYTYAKEAHDDYLAALTERGPIGLLGLLCLVGSVAVRARGVARAAMFDRRTAVPHPGGLLAAAAAAGVAGTYYEVLHFRFVWVLLAFIAAYGWQQAAGAASQPEAAP